MGGVTTSGAKRQVGAKQPGGKRLGGETTRGGNGLGAKHPEFAIVTQFGSPFKTRGFSVFKGKELNLY